MIARFYNLHYFFIYCFLQVVLACAAVAAVSGAADPILAYAHGLPYGGAYAHAAAPAYGYAAAPAYAYAAAPAYAYAAAAPAVAVAAPAAAYALPPTQIVNEAPVVEQVVEPVEQWGYKVAY
jgi:hypothetical protein